MLYRQKIMRFQYISDLHLERGLKYIAPKAPFLILAGDVAPLGSEVSEYFFSVHSPKFENIFYVHGNHEFDHYRNKKSSHELPSNVIVLQNKVYTAPNLGNILMVGCTLWTEATNLKENHKSIHFLSGILNSDKYLNYKILTITHHLPSYKLITKKYQHYPRKERFANNLDHFFDPVVFKNPPAAWICGHSHCVLETSLGSTRCMINCDINKITTFDL